MSENFLKSFVQYLRNNISTITFYPGRWFTPDRTYPCALIKESPGSRPFHGYWTHPVTVIVEDDSFFDCQDRAYEIYNLLLDGKGLVLPAVVTGDDAITAEVVEALTTPAYVGQNERNIETFSFNLVVRR